MQLDFLIQKIPHKKGESLPLFCFFNINALFPFLLLLIQLCFKITKFPLLQLLRNSTKHKVSGTCEHIQAVNEATVFQNVPYKGKAS